MNAPNLSYLSKFKSRVNAEAYAIPGWASFPRISVGNNRFTCTDAEGNETFLSVESIEFIVVEANPGVSKVYYDEGYDPAKPSAPSCFSDTGFSPDIRVFNPKAHFCHECPMNQWGSEISKMSGKALKSCGDFKKLAVYLLHDKVEGIFQLRVPSASLQNWNRYVRELHAIPTGCDEKLMPHHVVTRISWDKTKQNVLGFERIDYLDEDWLEVIMSHQDTCEYSEWIGIDQQSQQRRLLEATHVTQAKQIEHRPAEAEHPKATRQVSEEEILDVEPEKATPAPRKRPGAKVKEATVDEAPPAVVEAKESPMELARRRAKERLHGKS